MSDAVGDKRCPAALAALVARADRLTVVAHRCGSRKVRKRRSDSQHIENSEAVAVARDLCAEVDAASSTDHEIRAACPEAITLQQLGGRAGELEATCRIRSRHGAMRATERALTRSHRPLVR